MSSKRTKHINVRYFFIKDRVDSGELSIEHCSAEDMLGNNFTKPLQGSLFHKFHAEIMNLPTEGACRDLCWSKAEKKITTSSPQERVGDWENKKVSWADMVRSGKQE